MAGVTRHWVRHEHIWCDRMYVTIAPNVRNDIDVPSGMVMEMLPSELRSYGSIMWAHMRTCWPKLPVSASVRARLRSGRQSPLWQQRCPIGQSRTSISSLDEISAAAPHSPRGQLLVSVSEVAARDERRLATGPRSCGRLVTRTKSVSYVVFGWSWAMIGVRGRSVVVAAGAR